MLFKKRITKALNSLRGCAGWSAPVLFSNLRRQVFSRRGPYVPAIRECFHDSQAKLGFQSKYLVRFGYTKPNQKRLWWHCKHTPSHPWSLSSFASRIFLLLTTIDRYNKQRTHLLHTSNSKHWHHGLFTGTQFTSSLTGVTALWSLSKTHLS